MLVFQDVLGTTKVAGQLAVSSQSQGSAMLWDVQQVCDVDAPAHLMSSHADCRCNRSYSCVALQARMVACVKLPGEVQALACGHNQTDSCQKAAFVGLGHSIYRMPPLGQDVTAGVHEMRCSG